eukprot:1375671-Amorphochlora_amoeboformis.AAC.1
MAPGSLAEQLRARRDQLGQDGGRKTSLRKNPMNGEDMGRKKVRCIVIIRRIIDALATLRPPLCFPQKNRKKNGPKSSDPTSHPPTLEAKKKKKRKRKRKKDNDACASTRPQPTRPTPSTCPKKKIRGSALQQR